MENSNKEFIKKYKNDFKLNPMLPTQYSSEERARIRAKERKILEGKEDKDIER